MSGVLSPLDLERYRANFGNQFPAWALEHLAASPGAILSVSGTQIRVRTIVPARTQSGACHWFTADGRRAIHNEAPFGCAYSDLWHVLSGADKRVESPEDAWQKLHAETLKQPTAQEEPEDAAVEEMLLIAKQLWRELTRMLSASPHTQDAAPETLSATLVSSVGLLSAMALANVIHRHPASEKNKHKVAEVFCNMYFKQIADNLPIMLEDLEQQEGQA